jgi:hypothetical protein
MAPRLEQDPVALGHGTPKGLASKLIDTPNGEEGNFRLLHDDNSAVH